MVIIYTMVVIRPFIKPLMGLIIIQVGLILMVNNHETY